MHENYLKISSVSQAKKTDFSKIQECGLWNSGDEKEQKLHRIHAYPAKFPAFIATKAFSYAAAEGLQVKTIADIFCGCGTVAFETRRNNIDFWGCDINPVATLIAKAKSTSFKQHKLNEYIGQITSYFDVADASLPLSSEAIERLQYWHPKRQFNDLAKLKNSIEAIIPSRSNYRLFFYCAFSNILKPTSRWLTKSIKPQIDPLKDPAAVLDAFLAQCELMRSAYKDCDLSLQRSNITILNENVFDAVSTAPEVDMIVTSPPYVTSYEYADLHQLSSLWLGYANDYRVLRDGSIGSSQHDFQFSKEIKRLNSVGSEIVFNLYTEDQRIAKSVAKYFLDMQEVSKKCHSMLSKKGMAVFVIGNTEYRGVKVDNARHLSESLLAAGFSGVNVTKRRISNKMLTPYRRKDGRFSSSDSGKQIYGQEYILIARK